MIQCKQAMSCVWSSTYKLAKTARYHQTLAICTADIATASHFAATMAVCILCETYDCRARRSVDPRE